MTASCPPHPPLEPALPAPFRIGVRPLGEEPWLRVDGRLHARLDEKRRLLARNPDAVSGALPGTCAAAREARNLVAGWLVRNAAATHVRDGGVEPPANAGTTASAVGSAVGPALGSAAGPVPGSPVGAASEPGVGPRTDPASAWPCRVRGRDAPPADAPPLVQAALLVAEDLALMSRVGGRWHLVAHGVAFPSAWEPAAKLGLPMDEVHAPVPGFGPGTRHAALIGRMFDALRPGRTVRRGSWSLHADPTLHLPRHAPDHARRLAAGPLDALWLRRERQTLSRLPRSGDVLFTVDTTLDPVASLEARERAVLGAQLDALSPAERRYRSLPARGGPASDGPTPGGQAPAGSVPGGSAADRRISDRRASGESVGGGSIEGGHGRERRKSP